MYNVCRVSNSLDPDQALCSAGPDLGKTVCKSYLQMTLGDKELKGIYRQSHMYCFTFNSCKCTELY